MTVFAGKQWRIQERGPAPPLTPGSGRQPSPPAPLSPLSEGLDPPLAKFLFPVSNSRGIREKVTQSKVNLKAVGECHVWSRKKGKLERCSLTLALSLPAFCPLLTISLLSEEPLGQTKLFSEVSTVVSIEFSWWCWKIPRRVHCISCRLCTVV